jgi:hypothetical protein
MENTTVQGKAFFVTKKLINKKEGGKMVVFDVVVAGGVMTKLFTDLETIILNYEKIKVPSEQNIEFKFSEYSGLKINLVKMLDIK